MYLCSKIKKMRILLLGEYSNVHWTLAEGLRALGHQVTVVSDGDDWKNYPRDVNLRRGKGPASAINYLFRVLRLLPTWRGYDVVQLINPLFLELKAEHQYYIYRFIKRYNQKVFLAAYGMDYYWVHAGLDGHTFRYSDFNIGKQFRQSPDIEQWKSEWLHGEKGKLNRYIAQTCDGIIAGLYEYDASYRPFFPDKLTYIPFPINRSLIYPAQLKDDGQIRFFIGIQKKRNAYKGTDIMLRALERMTAQYPHCKICKAESIPFPEYQNMMNHCEVLLDQLYSYTPAMNALLAMAKGIVVVGGGEPENYQIIKEERLRPIINVHPDEEHVYQQLVMLAETPDLIKLKAAESIEYIKKHHDHIYVAQQYIDFWKSK